MGIPYLDNTFSSALDDFERRTGVKPGVMIRFDSGDTVNNKQVYYVEIHALGKSSRAAVTNISPEIIKKMCRSLRRAVGDVREIRFSDFDVSPYSGNYYTNTTED